MKPFKYSLIAILIPAVIVLAGCEDKSTKPVEQVDLKQSPPAPAAKPESKNSQKLVTTLAEQIKLQFQIVDNHAGENGYNCAEIGADWASCAKVNVILTNQGSEIDNKNWKLYFHSIREILKSEHPEFKVTRITGDLHVIEPTEQFQRFNENGRVEIPLISEYWLVNYSDVMPRWYFEIDGKTAIVKNTDVENTADFVFPLEGDNWKRTKADKNVLMTPESRFAKNQATSLVATELLKGQILPTPEKVELGSETISLKNGVNLNIEGLSVASLTALKNRFELLGVSISENGFPINGKINNDWKNELTSGAYLLKVTPEFAEIDAFDDVGLFYAVQSILSSIELSENPTLVAMNVEDKPRFDYRAIFLDIGRNFKTKDVILRLLEQMSVYKLNKFHFHLTDDEGWRIEIPGLPELTRVGSQRCHDLSEQKCLLPQLGSGPDSNNSGSGYLTRKDYVDIVKFAKDRFIEVIPEIDMPAHARAAVVSMEARYKYLMQAGKAIEAEEYRLIDPTDDSNTTSVQFYNRLSYLNPCLDSSRRFVEKVVTEIAKMHSEAEAPLQTWHYGGDEAKNIRFGAGYQDIHAEKIEPGKGLIDLSKEDHPWEKSQMCQKLINDGVIEDIEHLPSYFAEKVAEIVKNQEIKNFQAWQDGLKHLENAAVLGDLNTRINFWETLYWGGAEAANQWANKGFNVVISNPDYVYLDFPYEVNPAERGYYWGTRFNDEQKVFSFAPDNLPQNAETSVDRDGQYFSSVGQTSWNGAYGLSGQFWNETIRTDQQLEYMAYPRILALAERAWHKAGWELEYEPLREFSGNKTNFVDKTKLSQDWDRFASLLGQRELAKLEKSNIQYRLPVPGARVENQQLEMNIIFPGLSLEYSFDDGKTWSVYQEPVNLTTQAEVLVRSKSFDGKRESRIEKLSLAAK